MVEDGKNSLFSINGSAKNVHYHAKGSKICKSVLAIQLHIIFLFHSCLKTFISIEFHRRRKICNSRCEEGHFVIDLMAFKVNNRMNV